VAVAEPPTPVAQEATAPVAVEAAPVATPVTKAAPHAKAKAPEKVVVKVEAAASTKAAVVAKPTPTQAKLKKDGDPSLDDLLKEAGEDQPKKAAKPVLANKALSGEDFKHGMSAIAARAQGCYKATQGMAQIKITVAPSGQVSKVSVTGQFAGKAATFPPWDGGPQTFGYSYLLAE
jgi:hypothetical protein